MCIKKEIIFVFDCVNVRSVLKRKFPDFFLDNMRTLKPWRPAKLVRSTDRLQNRSIFCYQSPLLFLVTTGFQMLLYFRIRFPNVAIYTLHLAGHLKIIIMNNTNNTN